MHFQSMQGGATALNGVVILASNPAQAQHYAELLRAHAVEVVLATQYSAHLHEYSAELQQAAVVIADVGIAAKAIAALRVLREVTDPEAALLLIADTADLALARELRRHGANEYFAAPVDDDELIHATRDALGLGSGVAHRSRIIAVHGVVGGAGAGLISAGLAALTASQHGRRAVLLDMELGNASAGCWLGCDRPGELSAVLQTPERIDSALLEQVIQNPLAQLALLDGRSLRQDTPIVEAAACQRLSHALSEQYRYQFWRSSGLSRTASLSLQQADVHVLVCDGSLAALRNVRELLPWLKESQPQAKSILVFNQARPDGVLKADTFAEALGRPADMVLPYRAKLARQQLDGVLFNASSHALHPEFDALTRHVLGLPVAKPRAWWGAWR